MSTKKYGKYLLLKVKVQKKVENFVAKGEIARFEQFLLLSQCFQKSCATDACTGGKGLISYRYNQETASLHSDLNRYKYK